MIQLFSKAQGARGYYIFGSSVFLAGFFYVYLFAPLAVPYFPIEVDAPKYAGAADSLPVVPSDLPPVVPSEPLLVAPSEQAPSSVLAQTLDIPSDYDAHHDRELCDQVFGKDYLPETAKTQRSYCEANSPSSLQCFQARRWSGNDWHGDHMCLARGVQINGPGSEKAFSLPCHVRANDSNLATDSKSNPPSQPPKWRPLEDMGVYFFGTGIGAQLPDWEIGMSSSTGGGCSAESNNGQWILLVRREGNDNVWHKLMEFWQAMVTFDVMRMAVDPVTKQRIMTDKQIASTVVVIEDDRDDVYQDWWTMITGNEPIRRSSLVPGTCYAGVILPLAGSSSPWWNALLESVYYACRERFMLDAFRRRLFRYLGITPRPPNSVNDEPVITIVNRTRTRRIYNLDNFTDVIRARYPKSTINVVDFAGMDMKAQMELVQTTDVYIGVHGAAMGHMLWLAPESAVVEIRPVHFGNMGFRYVALLSGLAHFSYMAVWPEVYNQTVNGVPIPDGWTEPISTDWQTREWVYVPDDDFLALVDAGVRSQRNRKIG